MLLFDRLFSDHYDRFPSRGYLIPIALMLTFLLLVAFLCFLKIPKIIRAEGVIVPIRTYSVRSDQRSFLMDQFFEIGGYVHKDQILVRLQLDDGMIKTFLSPRDGFVVDSVFRNRMDGPLPDGALLFSIVDPKELLLQIDIPPSYRGSVVKESRVRYFFDTLTQSVPTNVVRSEIRLLEDERTIYRVFATVKPVHQRLDLIGKAMPVKLVLQDISLIDYFLVN